jgi:hypothetical protein
MSVPPCIHRRLAAECALCAGYWRFLESRFEAPHKNTPASRRAFWLYGGPVVAEVAMELRDQRTRRTADSPGPIA